MKSQKMAIMLTTAMTFKNLSHDKDIILLELVSLLGKKWTDTDVACCLSEEALDFILRHSKPVSKGEDSKASSLVEYFRFRGIVVWCACHFYISSFREGADQLVNGSTPPARLPVKTHKLANGPTPSVETDEPGNGVMVMFGPVTPVQAEKRLERTTSSVLVEAMKLVNGAIPLTMEELHSKGAMELNTMDLTWLSKGINAQDEGIQFLLSHQSLKEAVVRLLAHIDWVRIPVPLFVKVVEPLKVIPDSKLVDIFRFHSLKTMRLNWVYDDTYKLQSDGFVILKSSRSVGSAMCQLPNRLGDEVCVWRFTLEEVRPDVQLGFVCGEGIEEASRAWNTQRSCFVALGVNSGFMFRVIRWTDTTICGGPARLYFKSGQGGRIDGVTERSYMKKIQQVEFRYHRIQRSCDIKVDEENFGTMWYNLSGRSVFPIVSFESGSVRLTIVNGFEIL